MLTKGNVLCKGASFRVITCHEKRIITAFEKRKKEKPEIRCTTYAPPKKPLKRQTETDLGGMSVRASLAASTFLRRYSMAAFKLNASIKAVSCSTFTIPVPAFQPQTRSHCSKRSNRSATQTRRKMAASASDSPLFAAPSRHAPALSTQRLQN